MNFHEILYWGFSLKFALNFCLKCNEVTDTVRGHLHLFLVPFAVQLAEQLLARQTLLAEMCCVYRHTLQSRSFVNVSDELG